MQRDEYDKMAFHEDRHFWFMGTRTLVLDLLARSLRNLPLSDARILDLGCGTGYTTERVEALGARRVIGCDLSLDALKHATRRLPGHLLVRASGTALPFPDAAFDAVLALDVLEHIPDDHAAASEIARVLRPGGALVATVPAFRFLWSDHDDALHHVRRYTRGAFRRVLREAGLLVEYASYYNTFLFPMIAAVRLSQRVMPRRRRAVAAESDVALPAEPMNTLLRTVLEAERHWLGRLVAPVGVSVIATATRPLAERG